MKSTNEKFLALEFKEREIKALAGVRGEIQWLCLNDICCALGRDSRVDVGHAAQACRTSCRRTFREGSQQKWAVKPYDVHSLLRRVETENKKVAEICRELQEWINTLPVPMRDDRLKPPMPVDNTGPVIFNYRDNFPITFRTEAGRTMVNATQMARGFGKMPSEWLRVAQTTEYRNHLVESGVSESFEGQVATTRGLHGATWIEESLALEFARWLSPEFSQWCDEKIKELVNYGSATLQVRNPKNSSPVPAENFPVPQTLDEALMLAANQARKIREDQHKVEFYDEYIENRNCFKSTRIADELDITTVQLHRFLSEQGIVKYDKKRWVVHTPYRSLQCDVPYLWKTKSGKIYPFGATKRWTQAGREYILELWKERHPENVVVLNTIAQ